MQFILVTRPKAEYLPSDLPGDFVELLRAEEAHSREVYHQGVLRQSWSLMIEGTGAVPLRGRDAAPGLAVPGAP